MTERLADIGVRITGVRQLGSVVNAMRGIAASRAQQARNQLAAVDAYAGIIAAAIGRTQALAHPALAAPTAPDSQSLLVLFCAEQGFAGAFSERVLNAVGTIHAEDIFLIGTRGRAAAAERGIEPRWTAAMPAHTAGIPRLADRIVEAVRGKAKSPRVDVIHADRQPAGGVSITRYRVLPFDPTGFPLFRSPSPPLLNLSPAALLAGLTIEYLHGQLCAAALHAYAAENEARMEAMAAAHTQIERQLSGLEATRRLVRQEDITAEIIELAAGESASRSRAAGRKTHGANSIQQQTCEGE